MSLLKFLHLSDLHFHAKADNDALLERLTYIRSKYSDHYLIMTGDITDDGTVEQYFNALKSLRPFKRIYVGPGNHDYGILGNFYSREAADRFDGFSKGLTGQSFIGKSPTVSQVENTLIIFLNSNLETEDPFDFACGEIGDFQRNTLKWLLGMESLKGFTRIVCLHHHPFIHGDPTMELRDAKELIRLIYGKVDILLFGHKHERGRWSNKAGCKLALASGATFQEPYTWEITVEDGKIYSEEVPICEEK